jgi:hypothetical protein
MHEFPTDNKQIKDKVSEFEKACRLLTTPDFYVKGLDTINKNQQISESAYYFKRLAGIIR